MEQKHKNMLYMRWTDGMVKIPWIECKDVKHNTFKANQPVDKFRRWVRSGQVRAGNRQLNWIEAQSLISQHGQKHFSLADLFNKTLCSCIYFYWHSYTFK